MAQHPVAVVLLGTTLIVVALSQDVRSIAIGGTVVVAGTATTVAAPAAASTTVTARVEGIGTEVFNALLETGALRSR